MNNEAEALAGIRGTNNAEPKIQPGDVVTFTVGRNEAGPITKTVIWTGSDTGWL